MTWNRKLTYLAHFFVKACAVPSAYIVNTSRSLLGFSSNCTQIWKFSLVFVLLLLLGVFGVTQTAKADPHAIFYTAIGQQQLFFNVLAALDQADYVETQFERQLLVEKRGAVPAFPPFTPEQQKLVEETRVGPDPSQISPSDPGVSSLLSRLLTLEGTDLYTDFLIRYLGAEFARRDATGKLTKQLCQFALGREDCKKYAGGNIFSSEFAAYMRQHKRAIVNDPLEWGALPVVNGVIGALASGFDTQYRWEGLGIGGEELQVPYAHSPDIASWRAEALQRPDNVVHEALIDNLMSTTARSYLLGGYGYPYRLYTTNALGEYVVTNYPNGAPADVRRGIEAAGAAINAPLEADLIAAAAADRIENQLSMMEYQGVLADGKIFPAGVLSGDFTGAGGPMELSAAIQLPVAARAGAVHSLPDALAQVDTNQRFSTLAGLDAAGHFTLTDRPPVAGAQTGFGAADVLGAVAGDLALPPTSPTANIGPAHEEKELAKVLDILTNGQFLGAPSGGGFTF